jgi:hypothetical protein
MRIDGSHSTKLASAVPRRQFGVYHDLNAVVKAKKQKYSPSRRPLSWFFRCTIRDRILLQCESCKERTGSKRIETAGLNVAQNHGWGVSINPFNETLCLNFLSFVEGKTVAEAFKELDEPYRQKVLENIADCLVKCIKNRFAIKDPHFRNIIIQEDGTLIWLDTETKRTFSRKKAIKILDRILVSYCTPADVQCDELIALRELVLDKVRSRL